ncbi:MAG: DUF5694 domain-containing protein [Myxococcota bacterium]
MNRLLHFVFLTGLVTAPLSAVAEEAPVQVMILGTYHFANPGLDLVNTKVDDVLAERRQKEIAILVETLAAWKPTKIAVENTAKAPSLELSSYERVKELLRTSRNESVQIGYRLGLKLGHRAVYGYDEQPDENEPDYFPMGEVQAFAEQNGQMELLGRLMAEVKAVSAQQEAALPRQSIAESLLPHNDPKRVDSMHNRLYYSLLKVGDGDAQPGAVLNALWYMRNAKMFAKIDMIAKPGDRVLVIAGSGHATWLRHFVQRMPGYEAVEAVPYLRRAAGRTP